MVILQINYRVSGIERAEWEKRYTDATAEKFLKVDGLLWKIWLDAPDELRPGGIYLFASRAQAQAYLDGPIVAAMKANPAVADLTFRLSDVRERMTAITHGPVPGLAMAAE
jgi:hypothetical protein